MRCFDICNKPEDILLDRTNLPNNNVNGGKHSYSSLKYSSLPEMTPSHKHRLSNEGICRVKFMINLMNFPVLAGHLIKYHFVKLAQLEDGAVDSLLLMGENSWLKKHHYTFIRNLALVALVLRVPSLPCTNNIMLRIRCITFQILFVVIPYLGAWWAIKQFPVYIYLAGC